ncbi:sulfite exporter TauE/SafE family protein [Gloeocapsopsis crepidinum LEGE 06123]|uniref:Probable membrane transporter protein n=1 Tax=Gloeocapsopsis crepidinum LEGE 06123 TaxID=588587 RepID=A0ABR9UN95_9CHRO|nr:sulfite exporter TauE/SafE family protein [Gloeocapsopsis crepidinum]MBE9189750.1 sulfite exporter TauE/SafE family protein [Gloeocapsopsis crepidinum LEGE 06123]
MVFPNSLILTLGGLVAGILAGFLGIGGGTVLVPLMVALGYTPLQAVATSSLAIAIASISGSIQNWRMGYFDSQRVIYLGLPALFTAQIGVYLTSKFASYQLLTAFGLLLLTNIYLVDLKKHLIHLTNREPIQWINPVIARVCTGGAAGILAGLFSVGGGVIMVTMQVFLLGEPIKVAIQTSLGVIILTAISACLGHTLSNNVLFIEGTLLGIGGSLGVQVSTRILPKLPDNTVSLIFRLTLGLLSIYVFWQAWQVLHNNPLD